MNKERMILYCDRTIAFCLCFLIFCLPFAKAGVEIFVWFAFFFWILKRVFGYRTSVLWRMLPDTQLNRALGVFMVVNAISMLFSVNFALSFRGFFGKELKFMAIYFMLVEVISSRERLRNVSIFIIASAPVVITIAAVQFSRRFGYFLRDCGLERLAASFSSPNGFAGWLIVIIPLLLGILKADKPMDRKLKALLPILIIMLLVCLLLTFSRGAWLGIAVGACFMGCYALKNYSLRIKILCLSMGICLLVISLFLPQLLKTKVNVFGGINSRFSQTTDEHIKSVVKTKELAILIRINLWKEALRIIPDYPLTGCGLNTYTKVARNYKSFELGGAYPHNSFLQMAAEAGVTGLTSFILILIVFFKWGFQILKKRRNQLLLGILSGILAFLVQSFFDTNLFSLQLVVLFWFMMGLAAAVMKLELG